MSINISNIMYFVLIEADYLQDPSPLWDAEGREQDEPASRDLREHHLAPGLPSQRSELSLLPQDCSQDVISVW